MNNQEKGYKKLKTFQEAHKLVLLVYQLTQKFPKDEVFGMKSQIRRASVSIPANIIEGQARLSKKELRNFLHIANGSLVETEYYLELARDLGYINGDEYEGAEKQRFLVGSLLGGLIRSIKV